jgi:hypothetical protein
MERTGFEEFLELSVVLTGFSRVDLLGTGVAHEYYDTVNAAAGEAIVGRMLAQFAVLKEQHCGLDALEAAVQAAFWSDPVLGPVAQNIVQMWYLGQWNQLPEKWRKDNGAHPGDVTRVVSAAAYIEGLVWRAAGTHPSGAKQPGYGTWSFPPVQIATDSGKRAKAAKAGRGK